MTDRNEMPGNPRETGTMFVSQIEPDTKAPPALEQGILKWVHENLFSSVSNTILTIVGLLLVVYTIVNITNWVIEEANWLAINANLRQYMVGSFPPEQIWRIQVLTLFSIFVMGMAVAIWIKQIARVMFLTVVTIILVLWLLPLVTKSLVELPSYYAIAGQGVIRSGSVTDAAIPQVSFIGAANEEITIQLADNAVESEADLANLAGYMSSGANTLRNAAANRLELIAERDELVAQLATYQEAIAEDGVPTLTQAQVERYTAAVDAFEIPEPVIETYDLNSIAVQVSITNAETGEVLGEPVVLDSPDDVASFTLPADGWYVLEKVDVNAVAPEPDDGASETAPPQTNSQDIRNVSTVAPTAQTEAAAQAAETGGTLALLNISGIYPARLGNIPGEHGFIPAFVRATDFFYVPRAGNPVPRDEAGQEIPFIVLTSNQYRGERSLGDYLRAYLTTFFDRVKVPMTIFIAIGILGYFAATTIESMVKSQDSQWTWFDSLQVWIIALVILSLLLLPDAHMESLRFSFLPESQWQDIIIKVVGSLILAVYPLALLMQRAKKSTASNLATIGLVIIPVVMWIYVNGMSITAAVAWGGILALALQCLAVYRIGQRNGWRGWRPYGDAVDGNMLIVIAVAISYIALLILLEGINDGGWTAWVLRLGFIPLLLAAAAGSSLYTPDMVNEVPTRSVIAPFWVAGLIIVALFFSGVGLQNPDTNWLFSESNPDSWSGLLLTMMLTVYGIIIAFPIGVGLALGRRSDLPLIKYLCIAYIELIRGSPFITVLFFMKLLIPLIRPELAAVPNGYRAIIATIAFSAAYLAENVRGGLQSLPPGQTEAAKALGLSAWQTTILITLPQALRAVIPALVGQFISLFKDTSLVTIIGLIDLTGVVNSMAVQPEFVGTRLEGLVFISVIYFVFSYVLAYISRLLEASGSGATRRMT